MAKKRTTKKVGKKTAKKTSKKKVSKAPATRTTTKGPAGRSTDAKTLKAIESLATQVAKTGLAGKDPEMDVPSRSLSNTSYNKKSRILEMGDLTSARPLFDLKTSRKFMQTLLLSAGVKDLLEASKTLSLRGMYYKSLHTITGTKEKTLNDQTESDAVLEDLEVILGALREELHIFAKKRGTMVGNITVLDNGDEINCRKMGTGGYAIPSICEESVIKFKKCEADFILHVEKDTVWQPSRTPSSWASGRSTTNAATCPTTSRSP